ncbi:galactose oxidase precursor [Pseudomassariella vexata]|uniref:Galactose oxidase n=1 Tax=Pseudomassariella vexata TaxID=1141098 RepID=A0A1Y2E8Q9_9PEZI|nr:galactose oxidase precursor [Pseudomassariella vexata]ORY67245.1 galactose oxidase precursor [Pseudomassariella vexata]
MVRLNTIKATAVLLHIGVSTAITACPGAETVYTSTEGVRYAICPDTDYQGASLQIIPGVASTTACAARCEADARCAKGVFDTQTGDCHIKDNAVALAWVTNGRFDVIRLNNNFPEGTNIAYCPFSQTSYTAVSATYKICPGTDYKGASAQMVQGVASVTACAQLCGSTSGCKKAVYDNVAQVCHIKDTYNSATLIWAMNKRFDSITVDAKINFATQGNWTDIIRLPVIPVAAYVVPQFPEPTRMLVFSSWGDDTFGGAAGYTQFADYNFKTGAVSQRTVANTKHDMFCPGISSLADGRILITGGSNAEATSLYNPSTNLFVRGPDMKIARGYQTSTTLSNGKVFTIGGSYSGERGGKNGEVYDPATNTWTLLSGALVEPILTTDNEGIWREDNHGWLFGWKNGSVFHAGPSIKQHWYGTIGTGSVAEAGMRDGDDAMCGINVMYDATAGKIFTAGGSPDYTNSDATQRAHITTIGNPGTPSTVERVPDMTFPRGFANAAVLPDGTTLVTGGQRRSLVFTDTDGILTPELFNPVTKTWTQMAPEAVARNYHSVSLLLPDATVWSGGGGLCYVGSPTGSDAKCDKSVDHADGQIFSPPYLFNPDGTMATRPVISALSATSVKVGATITVTMSNNDATTFSLIRIGSATHSINSDQRRVPLTDITANGAAHIIQLPTDGGVLIPGHYYLFALSSNGVPSVARTLQATL